MNDSAESNFWTFASSLAAQAPSATSYNALLDMWIASHPKAGAVNYDAAVTRLRRMFWVAA